MTNFLDDYRLEDSIGYLVRRLARALHTHLNTAFARAGCDVNAEHWAILATLGDRAGQCQQYLAYVTCRDKTNITRLLDDMERRNLLVRVPDQQDRRQKLIYLTNAGKALYRNLLPVVQATLAEAQKDIDPDELVVLRRVLNQMYQNLDTGKCCC